MVTARVMLLQDRKGGDYICPQTVTTAIFDPNDHTRTLQKMLDDKCDKSQGTPKWDATTIYNDTSTVVHGNLHTIFMSKKDNNVNHPPSGAEDEWWTPVKGIDPSAPKVHLELIPQGTTEVTVHHGLGDEDVLFSMRDTVTKKYISADVEYIGENDLKVSFSKPTPNQIRMFIMASPQV